MKRFMLIGLMLMASIAIAFADTAVQTDQNAGFLHFDNPTVILYPNQWTDIYGVAPASDTIWAAANPDGHYVVLPERCKGFIMTVFGGDAIIGDPADIATGAEYVGIKVASGTPFKWDSRNPDQRTIRFRVYMNGAANGVAAFCGWGN